MAQVTPPRPGLRSFATPAAPLGRWLALLCLCAAGAAAQTPTSPEVLKAEADKHPDDAAAQFRLAQGWAAAKQPTQAMEAVERALALAPQNAEYWSARAQYANWLGHRAEACDALARVVVLQPENDDALLSLARSESWAGRLDSSVRHFRRYVKRHADDKAARMDHIKTESWRGNYATALALLEEYGAKFGTGFDYRKQKARILASAGRVTEAQELLNALLKEAPDDYELHFTQTLIYHNGRQPRLAVESLSELTRCKGSPAEVADARRLVTTELRDQVMVGAEYYTEKDSVKILRYYSEGRLQLNPEVRLLARVEGNDLWADRGSGLENVDGHQHASYERALAGAEWRLSPQWDLELLGGMAEADKTYTTGIYHLLANYQPVDTLAFLFDSSYDYYAVSPRAVSLGIRREDNRLQADWDVDLTYHVAAAAAYDMFSDSNQRWEALLAPRAAVVRSQSINLDVGPHLWWYGFSDDLNHGYYDPYLFQRYAWNTYVYWKISGDDGIGAVVSLGEQKDDRESKFTFSASWDLEGRFGVYRDWMLVLRVADMHNSGGMAGGGGARIYTAQLTRRF